MERARECAVGGRRERMFVQEQGNVKARRRNMITGERGGAQGRGQKGERGEEWREKRGKSFLPSPLAPTKSLMP